MCSSGNERCIFSDSVSDKALVFLLFWCFLQCLDLLLLKLLWYLDLVQVNSHFASYKISK